MTTVLSTRNDLGAPPPPIVAGRLLALHCRLLRLSGSPEQAQRALDRATWYSATCLAFERAATALTLGDHDLARKLIDGFAPQPDAAEPLGDGGRPAPARPGWPKPRDRSTESQEHLAAAMAVAETHSLVESFVRAGPAIIRTGVRA